MPDPSFEPPVPLADAEIAQRIADAARAGRPVDRSPTIEQLLLAFGEDADSGTAPRVRVARALAIAGVGVTPDLLTVPIGTRVFLAPGPAPKRRRRGRALALGLLLMVLLLGGAAAAALTLGDGGTRVSDLLPGGSSSSSASGPTTSETGTAATTTAPTTATETTPTPAEEQARKDAAGRLRKDAAAKPKSDAAAAEKRRKAEARRKEDERKAREERERKAAARRRVVVTLTPAAPTYLCVDDGAGKRLFGGTLSAPRTFKAKRLRMNIGLSSVKVTAAGKPVPLSGSPSGYLFQAGGKAPQYLPLGQRPEC
jgi:hypothetical protein